MDENQIHLIKSKMMAPRILDSEGKPVVNNNIFDHF